MTRVAFSCTSERISWATRRSLWPSSSDLKVAGRLIAWRGHGKTVFAHLADDTGRIQLYFRKDQLGDATFALAELFRSEGRRPADRLARARQDRLCSSRR